MFKHIPYCSEYLNKDTLFSFIWFQVNLEIFPQKLSGPKKKAYWLGSQYRKISTYQQPISVRYLVYRPENEFGHIIIRSNVLNEGRNIQNLLLFTFFFSCFLPFFFCITYFYSPLLMFIIFFCKSELGYTIRKGKGDFIYTCKIIGTSVLKP